MRLGRSCVYKLTNLVNGKIYIGKTINYDARMYTYSRFPFHSAGTFRKNQDGVIQKTAYGFAWRFAYSWNVEMKGAAA